MWQCNDNRWGTNDIKQQQKNNEQSPTENDLFVEDTWSPTQVMRLFTIIFFLLNNAFATLHNDDKS